MLMRSNALSIEIQELRSQIEQYQVDLGDKDMVIEALQREL